MAAKAIARLIPGGFGDADGAAAGGTSSRQATPDNRQRPLTAAKARTSPPARSHATRTGGANTAPKHHAMLSRLRRASLSSGEPPERRPTHRFTAGMLTPKAKP